MSLSLAAALVPRPGNAQGIAAVSRQIRMDPAPGFFLIPRPAAAAPPQAGAAPFPIVRSTVIVAPPRSNPIETDRRVLEFHRKRAGQGVAYAQFELGKRYLHGRGVPQNLRLAKVWLEAAARQGHEGAIQLHRELDKPRDPSDNEFHLP